MLIDKLAARAKEIGLNLYTLAVDEGDGVRIEHTAKVNMVNDIYSVSKNFTTTGVLMAVERGYISLSDNVYDLFADEYAGLSDGWKSVTLRHVLSQTTGIGHGYLDVDGDNCAAYPTRDYLSLKLGAELVHPAGEVFCYSDSNFYLASRMAAKAMGRPLGEFLQRELFTPMDFQGHAWALCPDGHIIGGSGLFLRIEDLHKLARLYTNMGVYEGRRYLSEETCIEASKDIVRVDAETTYGLSFWRHGNYNAFQGNGMLGQGIYMSPDKNLSAAWQCVDFEGKSGELLSALLEEETPRS